MKQHLLHMTKSMVNWIASIMANLNNKIVKIRPLHQHSIIKDDLSMLLQIFWPVDRGLSSYVFIITLSLRGSKGNAFHNRI